MKKVSLLLIAAILCLASCTKKENEDINENINNRRPSKSFPVPITIGHYWWYSVSGLCIEPKVSDSLCFISIHTADYAAMQCNAIITDGNLDKIEINNGTLANNGLNSTYQKYIRRGFIVFSYDCPILDTAFSNFINTTVIPSGVYPVYSQGNNTVIDL